MVMVQMTRSQPTKRERYTVAAIISLMAVVALVCVVLVVMLSRLDHQPRWWPGGVESAEKAVQLENAISTQLTAVRPPESPRWTAALSASEINAWLEHRLRPTVETHAGADAWTNEIDAIRVSILDDRLVVGALVEHGSGRAFIWSECVVSVEDDQLVVGVKDPRIGATRVPMRVIRSVFPKNGSARFNAYIDLEDGRTARVVALRIHDGRIELVIETVNSE